MKAYTALSIRARYDIVYRNGKRREGVEGRESARNLTRKNAVFAFA
jgi:hypothetical protein